MNLLQISAPKSGSYWLHTILLQILEKKNIQKQSFIEKQPVFQKIKNEALSFKEQAAVDTIDIENEGFFFRISSLHRERIENIAHYSQETSLAWTHSTYCDRTAEAFSHFQKKIFIIRDPRDRALSAAKFAFTNYMQRYYPTAYVNAEDYLDAEYERLLEQWNWYVSNYWLHKEELDVHFVFYERLLADFENELNKLLEYIEVDLPQGQKDEIAKAVSFSSMKNESPEHLNKGKYGKWMDQLNDKQKQIAVEKCGTLLHMLNYPLKKSDAEKLPFLPKGIDKEKLHSIINKTNWQNLFPESV